MKQRTLSTLLATGWLSASCATGLAPSEGAPKHGTEASGTGDDGTEGDDFPATGPDDPTLPRAPNQASNGLPSDSQGPNSAAPATGTDLGPSAQNPEVPGAGNPSGSAAPSVAFSCDDTAAPESTEWRRLTLNQYQNTLADLLSSALGDVAKAQQVYSTLGTALAALPTDERPKLSQDLKGTYRRLDQGVAQSHIDNWYQIGVQLGAALTSTDNLTTVVGDCAVDDDAVAMCLDGLIRNFGARVLRRPLDDDEVASYADVYGDTSVADPAAYADVIATLLNAPEFLYLVEHGESATTAHPEIFSLGAFELAQRLSYHFWDTMPDLELWQSAADGSLLNDDELERQVTRLVTDPRALVTTRGFFRDWLKLDNLNALDQAKDQPVFRAFAADDSPTPSLRENMISEVLDLVDAINANGGNSFEALFTTQLIAPKTDDLAHIYGVDPQDAPFEAPNADRPGLFTRAAFLATGSANTRPIQKGVFLRENVLCDAIPPPPANAAAKLPELDPEYTTREVVEALTEAEGTACQGCHEVYINPLGFISENYDALGRTRTEQTLFDADGNVTGSRAVNTETTPQVNVGDTATASTVPELMKLIEQSGKAHACFARQYFRFSFGRWEDPARDGCELERLRQTLTDTGSISEMLRTVALSPEFRQRTID